MFCILLYKKKDPDKEKRTMGKYFGTDGFRGEAGVTLTADHAYKVGRFLGWYYNALRQLQRQRGACPHRHRQRYPPFQLHV